MTPSQKESIMRLRRTGIGYAAIAEKLGLSKNTVKTFCRRNDLTGTSGKTCLQCGKPVDQTPGRKTKKFCCDLCRSRYWDSHIGETKRGNSYEHICPVCGNTFYAYKSRNRKYCSTDCYFAGRFGGTVSICKYDGSYCRICDFSRIVYKEIRRKRPCYHQQTVFPISRTIICSHGQ